MRCMELSYLYEDKGHNTSRLSRLLSRHISYVHLGSWLVDYMNIAKWHEIPTL